MTPGPIDRTSRRTRTSPERAEVKDQRGKKAKKSSLATACGATEPQVRRRSKETGLTGPETPVRMFGGSLADIFRTPAYDCRALGSDQKTQFAVTRLRSAESPRIPGRRRGLNLRLAYIREDRSMARHLQRNESRSNESYSVRHDIHRSELQDGNVGPRAFRLPSLLRFRSAA